MDVLYNHFAAKSRSILPEPQATIVQPMEDPGADADHAEKSTYHETMTIWHRWQADYHMQQWRKEVQERQGTVENRLEEQQTMSDLLPGIIKRLGPPTITLEQQTLVQYYVSQLSKTTNKPPATIYASLKAAFRVPLYQELPESAWESVVQWFKRQMPGQELPSTQDTLF